MKSFYNETVPCPIRLDLGAQSREFDISGLALDLKLVMLGLWTSGCAELVPGSQERLPMLPIVEWSKGSHENLPGDWKRLSNK